MKRLESRHGWFFFSYNGDIYKIHVSFGRVAFTVERSDGYRAERKARMESVRGKRI